MIFPLKISNFPNSHFITLISSRKLSKYPDSQPNLQIPGRILFFSRNRPMLELTPPPPPYLDIEPPYPYFREHFQGSTRAPNRQMRRLQTPRLHAAPFWDPTVWSTLGSGSIPGGNEAGDVGRHKLLPVVLFKNPVVPTSCSCLEVPVQPLLCSRVLHFGLSRSMDPVPVPQQTDKERCTSSNTVQTHAKNMFAVLLRLILVPA